MASKIGRPPKVASMPGMELQGRTWFAVLRVPIDVKTTMGKTVLKKTTGERDPHKAAPIAAGILAEWRKRIDAIRQGKDASLAALIEEHAARVRQARRLDPEDEYPEELQEAFEELADKVLGRPIRLVRETGDVAADILASVSRDERRRIERVIDQVEGTATPFLAHADDWHADLPLQKRQASMYLSDVKQFASLLPEATLQNLQDRHVREWVDLLMRGAEPVTAKTMNRKLSTLRNYWGWLQRGERVEKARTPFRDVELPRAKRREDDTKRRPFSPADVVKLYRSAKVRGDVVLADLILFGAYTGGRIEELCTAHKQDVVTDAVGLVVKLDSKTEAGRREVPVHAALVSLVERLVRDADRDGYLIHSTADNRNDERSPPLGQRFTRLKSAEGFDGRYVFHSIRKTVATLFKDAECPETIAGDMMGHEVGGMTYGLYAGGSSMAKRREWIERALVYPSFEA